MNESFLVRLQEIRDKFGVPMMLSSAYRCPAWNARQSKTGANGPHTSGRAVDVLVSGNDALRLIGIALEQGITGVGVNQKGEYTSRFLHIDDLTEGIRPHTWSY